jgi:N6-adenosine-specific RNA methylase IME4
MTLKEICDLGELIKPITAPGAVLFLWVPEPLEENAWPVSEALGFKRKGRITWIKEYHGKQRGLGFWYPVETEALHYAASKTAIPFRYRGEPNYFMAPVGKHSEKPEKARFLVEQAVASTIPNPLKLELFARKEVPGWVTLGLDLNGLDIKEELKALAMYSNKEDLPTGGKLISAEITDGTGKQVYIKLLAENRGACPFG